MSDMLSVRGAARSLGVSERTVWRRIRTGDLETEREGGRVWVRLAERVSRSAGVAEAAATYGAEPGPRESVARSMPEHTAWPLSPEHLEHRRQELLARRRAAAVEMDRLAAETRPDREGLSVVDYIRELREQGQGEARVSRRR